MLLRKYTNVQTDLSPPQSCALCWVLAPQVGKTHGSQSLAWGPSSFSATCVMSLDVISQTQSGFTLKPSTTQQMSCLSLLSSPHVCSPNRSKKEFRKKEKKRQAIFRDFFPTFLQMKNNPFTHQHCQRVISSVTHWNHSSQELGLGAPSKPCHRKARGIGAVPAKPSP